MVVKLGNSREARRLKFLKQMEQNSGYQQKLKEIEEYAQKEVISEGDEKYWKLDFTC